MARNLTLGLLNSKPETMIFELYPYGAGRNTPPVMEVKVKVVGGYNEHTYKTQIKPALEKAKAQLRKKYPGDDFWDCRK